MPQLYLAADLGAGSGRVMAAQYDGNVLRLEAAHRFDNTPVTVGGHLHWNILSLYSGVVEGIRKATAQFGTAASVGIEKFRKGPFRTGLMATTNIPMTNPEIVTGVSMMLLFVFIGRIIRSDSVLGFGTMLIAHVTFNLPYVILTVLPKLRQTLYGLLMIPMWLL